jgi:UDP-N-acetylglucosamine/UDP-N-acetylgalactosamine diphosphorylase
METAQLKQKLDAIGQGHVLRFFDSLGSESQLLLMSQLAALDLDAIAELAETYVRHKPPAPLPKVIEPVAALPRLPDGPRKKLYADAAARGRELLEAGKVGAFLVAGGQGTRLGYDGPKGEFPVTPIRNKSLFQVFAEQLLGKSRRAGRPIAWYIMTSDINDAATRAFFKRNQFFGYDPADVFFFQQGMMPAFSMDGRLLLAARDSLALSPDGHGGSLRALAASGALADMNRRGIEHLSYFQVDNPLVYCIDPLFLGLHDLTGSEMSSKTVVKAGPTEKVGNFVVGDGAVQVIEYSDLPAAMAAQQNADGSPRFNFGSIAIHALRVAFVQRLNEGGRLHLAWHRAEKKVPYIDDAGNPVNPTVPNAVKLEQFVFDAIPLAQNAMVYTTDRAEEFSPVKNAQGVDSPDTCRRDQIRRAARWLEGAGTYVASRHGEPDVTLEISPLFAPSPDALDHDRLPRAIGYGESVYLGD